MTEVTQSPSLAKRAARAGIQARIEADSVNPHGDRITSFVAKLGKPYIGELARHRSLSLNVASSRAVGVKRMLEQVRDRPALPPWWTLDQPGSMSGGEVASESTTNVADHFSRQGMTDAVHWAEQLVSGALARQHVNRYIEPWMIADFVATGTDDAWTSFFALRCSDAAQPEMQVLADLMLGLYLKNTPREKRWGDWHVAFDPSRVGGLNVGPAIPLKRLLTQSVSRSARVSFAMHDADDGQTHEQHAGRHDRLLASGHFSCFEQQAQATPGRHRNFSGWLPYRALVEQPSEVNLHDLARSRGVLD